FGEGLLPRRPGQPGHLGRRRARQRGHDRGHRHEHRDPGEEGTPMSTAAAVVAAGGASTTEAWFFWILGPIAVLAALGMVIARNAVHSALWLVVVMGSLGVFYVIQSGPFLGLAQIIVYTGAIMMLFLFVLMLVGRDASDSLIEVLRGQRV